MLIYCGAPGGQQTWPRACEDKQKYRNSFAGEDLPANVAARVYAGMASFILRSTHTVLRSTQWRTFSGIVSFAATAVVPQGPTAAQWVIARKERIASAARCNKAGSIVRLAKVMGFNFTKGNVNGFT
jgi:hypothetical protein